MLPGIRKKTLGAQLSFLARGPQAALDTPTVHEFVLSHTSKLQPRDCPSNWMPPKSPNLLKSSACSPPLLPPPQTSGSPSTMAAPAHLLLKPEAWEPSWMRPPLHQAPSVQPRAWECRLPHCSDAHCGAACWTQVPQPAGPHGSPRALWPVPVHTHAHALLCGLWNLLHVTGTTVFNRLKLPHPPGLLPLPPCPSDSSHLRASAKVPLPQLRSPPSLSCLSAGPLQAYSQLSTWPAPATLTREPVTCSPGICPVTRTTVPPQCKGRRGEDVRAGGRGEERAHGQEERACGQERRGEGTWAGGEGTRAGGEGVWVGEERRGEGTWAGGEGVRAGEERVRGRERRGRTGRRRGCTGRRGEGVRAGEERACGRERRAEERAHGRRGEGTGAGEG